MTDYKQLCARMADELDHYRQLLMDDRHETHALATEARAALLQHLQPLQPVAVGERLPCAEDCDAEGRCWFHSVGRKWCDWYLLKASCATETETHWLPAHALPLPAGEVQP